ncbi:MAG TPA: hypothetical protein O0X27_05470, partial [Methanocorpusculum sp.]|nr:hypothetical protein [Methanocorpusculum sp.]
MPESDDIADMMDMSSVAEFLESVQSVGFFRRLFGWRRIREQAWQAAFALEMISEEYRDKILSYRRTVKRFEDDVCRAYAQYYALLDEKQSSADWPSDREL